MRFPERAKSFYLGAERRVLVLAAAICGFVFSACSKDEETGFVDRDRVDSSESEDSYVRKPSKACAVPQPATAPVDQGDDDATEYGSRFQRELLEKLIADWDEASGSLRGEELLKQQWEIERRALALGPGDAFLQFLEFLSANAANDVRSRVISEVGNEMFSGPDAGQAREWLVTVENADLRVGLCRYAGKHHSGAGLKEFIGRFAEDGQCQSTVLTAYCKKLAATDPSGAVKTFLDLRPPNVNFDGLVVVMSVLPPESDFPAISSVLPGDSKAIAKCARSVFLKSWVKANPVDAAQYVISNTTMVHPDQMAVVVQAWSESAPEEAAAWIDALSPGEIKDQGVIALTRHWLARDPMKAWECASKVGDLNKRVESATQVFKEWEKSDRDAAVKAWLVLFPGSPEAGG